MKAPRGRPKTLDNPVFGTYQLEDREKAWVTAKAEERGVSASLIMRELIQEKMPLKEKGRKAR